VDYAFLCTALRLSRGNRSVFSGDARPIEGRALETPGDPRSLARGVELFVLRPLVFFNFNYGELLFFFR
jgi:hypothetical protein